MGIPRHREVQWLIKITQLSNIWVKLVVQFSVIFLKLPFDYAMLPAFLIWNQTPPPKPHVKKNDMCVVGWAGGLLPIPFGQGRGPPRVSPSCARACGCVFISLPFSFALPYDLPGVVCLSPNQIPSLSLSSVGTVLLCQANQEGSSMYSAPSSLVYTSASKPALVALFVLWHKSESNHLPCHVSSLPFPLHHPPLLLSVRWSWLS